MKELEFHEIAGLFPLMFGEEFAPFKRDIGDNGLLQPITLYEGKILDGRNRYNACKELGIEPEFEEYTGDKPLEYVLGKNLFRRHLTTYQRIEIGFKMEPIWGEKAKGQMGTRTDLYQNSDKGLEPINALEEVSKALEISSDTYSRGKYINKTLKKYIEEGKIDKEKADKIEKDLRDGKTSINKVYEDLKEKGELVINNIHEAKLHQNKMDKRIIIWESNGCPEDVGIELIKDQAKFIEVMRKKCREDAIELLKVERKIGGILTWFEKGWPEVYSFIITYKEKGKKLDIYKNLGIVTKKCDEEIEKKKIKEGDKNEITNQRN